MSIIHVYYSIVDTKLPPVQCILIAATLATHWWPLVLILCYLIGIDTRMIIPNFARKGNCPNSRKEGNLSFKGWKIPRLYTSLALNYCVYMDIRYSKIVYLLSSS